MKKKYFIETQGCQMNEYDSDKMKDLLSKEMDFENTNNKEDADILIVNTCSIREKAQEKVFSLLGKWRKLKNKKPDLVIGVAGCVASQESTAITSRAPYVDMVIGPQTIHRLPKIYEQSLKSKSTIIDVEFPLIEKFDNLPRLSNSKFSEFVTIMEGCSKYCSYCVVPYTRGTEVSRPLNDILKEIENLVENGTWDGATWGSGRWAASSSWLLVQLDHAKLKADGFTIFWKDSHPEKKIRFAEDGFLIGGYRLHDSELVLHPPNYSAEDCPSDDGLPCSVEWTYMDLEGRLRSTDNTVVTLLVGQSINVEVNREMQSSFALIIMMGLAVIILLYLSLRRLSDVLIVGVALGGALLWMQGMIGHASSLFNVLNWDLLARSQFSNLLPILVLALGIDDSLHALHRYKEERALGKDANGSAQMTLHRVGRAILLTTLTTIAAFSANLFSDVAALRSFGLEAAFGLVAAFLLTGMWVPLLRLSADEWLEKRDKSYAEGSKSHLISPEKLK